ncbi:hypothetical protein BDV3_002792 [Batrachochytrium dendrobatidis]|nr:hypothetical protein O5D80_000914 [Batrachochytrium dendrobatidis]
MQCSYYLCLSTVVFLFALLTGAPTNLHQLLSFSEIDPSTALGWSLFFAFLVAASISCFFMLIIVERARLCLDFACTLHILHWLLVSIYSGRSPNSLIWWVLLAGSTAMVSFGGEYLCLWRELEPIPLSTAGPSAGSDGRSSRRRRSDLDPDSIELEKLNPTSNNNR